MKFLYRLERAFTYVLFLGIARLTLHYVGWFEMADYRLEFVQWVTGIALVLTLWHVFFSKDNEARPQDAS